MAFDGKLTLNNRNCNIKTFSYPSEIELVLSRSCNKKCVFCPHINTEYIKYNNTKLQFMEIDLVKKMSGELIEMGYRGKIYLSGLGEPTMNPNYEEIIGILLEVGCDIKMITNGYSIIKDNYLLSDELLHKVEVVISVYNSSDIDIFEKFECDNVKLKKLFLENDDPLSVYEKFDFNNRCGFVFGDDKYDKCYYPFFMLFVDTNGDVQYCPHDWEIINVIGNVYDDTIIDIWNKDTFVRKMMLNENRQNLSPCNECSAKGIIIGEDAYNDALKKYEKNINDT